MTEYCVVSLEDMLFEEQVLAEIESDLNLLRYEDTPDEDLKDWLIGRAARESAYYCRNGNKFYLSLCWDRLRYQSLERDG